MTRIAPGPALAVLWMAFVPARAGAQEEPLAALPCRPTIACTATIVPAGSLEVEAGYIARKLHATVQHATPFVLKYSVLALVQLQLGSNGLVYASSSELEQRYFDDVYGVVKVVLANQSRIPAIAVSASLSVPTFAGQVGYVRTYDATAILYLTKDLWRIHADLNVAAGIVRLERDPVVQPSAALALSTQIAGPLGAMLEAYGFADAAPVATADAGLLGALAYAVTSSFIVDAGADLGLDPQVRRYGVFVGVTWVVRLARSR